MDNLKLPVPFKKFWVVEVNNWIVGVSYNGKSLKENHKFPSFRKFHFIKNVDQLKHFTPHDHTSNESLCATLLFWANKVLEETNK